MVNKLKRKIMGNAPFKMKHQGSPFNMFGGVKSSPAKAWWQKMKDFLSKGNAGGDDLVDAEDGIENNARIQQVDGGGNVPQHGPEAHAGGGGGASVGPFGGGFLRGAMGMMGGAGGRGTQGTNSWWQRNRG